MMDKFTQKVLYFMTALKDVYRDDGDRELFNIPKLELTDETIEEDMTAMLYAMFMFYKAATGEKDADIIDFQAVCSRLAMKKILKDEKEDYKNENDNG